MRYQLEKGEAVRPDLLGRGAAVLVTVLFWAGCQGHSFHPSGPDNGGEPTDAAMEEGLEDGDGDDGTSTDGPDMEEPGDEMGRDPIPDLDGPDTGEDVGEEEEPFGGPLPLYQDRQRPFLMLDREDLEGVREQIAVEGSVAALLWERVRSRCDQEVRVRPDPEVYDPYTEEWNANIARACAFEGLIVADVDCLARAAEILLGMQTDVETTPTNPSMLDKPTILGGPAVMGYAQAYDLLMAEPTLSFESMEESERARDLLLEHADNLRDFYLEDWLVLLVLTRNNHNIKHAAGIGMAALAVPEDEGALMRLSFGVTELMYHLFESQFVEDGGYAEGPGYLSYSAVSYFPFLYALHRALDGGAIDLWYSCATVQDESCQPEVRSTLDPWLDERFGLLHRWAFHLAMPNGALAPFDDAGFSTFPWPFVEAQLGSGPWMWWWHHGSWPLSTGGSLELAPDILSLPVDLESWLDPGESEPKAVVYYESGQALFRTGYGTEDAFASLLGEHGKARLGGHEHPDSTSFTWFAGGDYAFIDTGYFGYTDRLETATADQHNLVLVNGAGPPTGILGNIGTDVDSYLENCEIEETRLPTCMVRTSYEDTDVHRRLVMIGDRAIVLVDELHREQPARFTHLLHGGTPPESAQMTANGALWSLGQASFEGVVQSPDHTVDYQLQERLDTTTPARRHAVLNSSVQDVTDGFFLSLLYRHGPDDTAQVTTETDDHLSIARIADDSGDLLQVALCVDGDTCSEGLTLDVAARPDGMLPGLEMDLHREWTLAGTAP